MGITWIRNGVVVDRPADKGNTMHQTFEHTFTKTEANDQGIQAFTLPKNTIDSVAQAASDVNAALRSLQATRDADTKAAISKATADDANFKSATNLTQTSGVPGTNNGTWIVKPIKS